MNKMIVMVVYLLLLFGCTLPRDDNHSILLGNGYFIERYNSGKAICNRENTLVVFNDIIEWNHDGTFIVAYRYLSEDEIRKGKGNPYWDSQYNGDTLQYWIINKKTDSIYGPLNSMKYLDERASLNISKNLILKKH